MKKYLFGVGIGLGIGAVLGKIIINGFVEDVLYYIATFIVIWTVMAILGFVLASWSYSSMMKELDRI